MYKNGDKPGIVFSVLLLLLLIDTANSKLLFDKGWYKSSKQGQKRLLTNVKHLDKKVVPNSRYLRVSGRIGSLPRGSVRNLVKLTTLRLSLCGIKDVLPGAFVNLPSLTTLSLLDNEIEHVRSGVFNNLTLSTLFLHRNQIKTIDADAFNDMPNLYRLKVNQNRIAVWDSNWFANTPHITELFFRRNLIQKIPERAFKNLKGSHTHNGTYTVDTKIYLSKNNISIIDRDAFEGLDELSQLWLDRNQLTEIDVNLFSHMNQIGVIFLSKNKLRSLPKNLFRNFKLNLFTLDLTANNNLTCLPYEIVSKVNITGLMENKRLDCKCVRGLIEQLIENNKNNEIKTACLTVEA